MPPKLKTRAVSEFERGMEGRRAIYYKLLQIAQNRVLGHERVLGDQASQVNPAALVVFKGSDTTLPGFGIIVQVESESTAHYRAVVSDIWGNINEPTAVMDLNGTIIRGATFIYATEGGGGSDTESCSFADATLISAVGNTDPFNMIAFIADNVDKVTRQMSISDMALFFSSN